MTQKKYYLTLLFLGLAFLSHAQPYQKSLAAGKMWEIAWPQGMGAIAYERYCLQGDTLLDSHSYYQVRRPNGDLLGFVREDTIAEKVFYREASANQEELLIDYQLLPGDTFNYSGFVLTVDSVANRLIFGSNRKVIYFNSYQSFIEGIGHSFYGVIKDINYKSVISVQTGGNCVSVEDTFSNDVIRVFPNPFQHAFFILIPQKMTQQTARLYNDAGQLLLEKVLFSNKEEIILGDLASGIYTLRVDEAVFKLQKY